MQTVVQKAEVIIIAGLGTMGINGYNSVQNYMGVDHLYKIYFPSLLEIWEYLQGECPIFHISFFFNSFVTFLIVIELYIYYYIYNLYYVIYTFSMYIVYRCTICNLNYLIYLLIKL